MAKERGTRLDLTGQRFGRLVAIKVAERKRDENGRLVVLKWVCQCDCGNVCEVIPSSLTRGDTKSCGCLCREYFAARKPAYEGVRCPYPASACEKSKWGVCCYDCDKRGGCKMACLNSPSKCGKEDKEKKNA